VGEHLTGFFEYSTDYLRPPRCPHGPYCEFLLEASSLIRGAHFSLPVAVGGRERSRVLTTGMALRQLSRSAIFRWFARTARRAPEATAVSRGPFGQLSGTRRRGSAIATGSSLRGIGS